MGDTGHSKKDLIKHIFKTMEYDNNCENITQVTEWLKKRENRIFAYIEKKDETPTGEISPVKNATNNQHLCDVHVPDAPTIEAVLKKVAETKNTWRDIPATKRAEIIYKLGTEIQKKQDLFTQLEVAARGILSKDTKTKALSLLTDCLAYYSGFSVKCSASLDPKGLAVGILPDYSALWTLGYLLGPCLAAGRQVILQTGPRLSLLATLLIETAAQLGIPEGTIRLIPGNVDPNNFFINPHVSTVSIFDDVHKEQYLFANNFGKKLLHFGSSGASMIVFENCDLDSACHSVTDAAFGTKGMLPWSVRNIFVQENVFDNFVQKLKRNMTLLKVGKSNDKNVDIVQPDNTVLDKVKRIVQEANNEGVEVFEAKPDSVVPILLIGGNVFPNNVIKEDFIDVPVVTVVSFRTINEAVALANNTRQGFGVSVWTESTSLVHEITGKLKVGNIWVNSHGLFAAHIATSPYKTSGNAYFGGSEGFYEYIQSKALKNETVSQIQNKNVMEQAITDAKKVQDGWSKLDPLERTKLLQVAAQSLKSDSSLEKWVDEWVSLIYECGLNTGNFTKLKNFNVVTSREPCGIIAVETPENKHDHNKRLIVAALSEGNALIVLNDCDEAREFYTQISKLLPKGVVTVLPHSQEATKVAGLHKELNVYVGTKHNKVFFSLPLKTSSKFKVANSNSWKEVRDKVTLVKNVWLNKGQSFQ